MRASIVLALAALAAGCSGGADEAANNQNAGNPNEREAQIGQVGLRYNTTRLAVAPVQIGLPPDEKRKVRGMKLISAQREPLLRTAACPEQEGKVCAPEAEGGLTLTVLNQSLPEFSAPIKGTKPATVAGLQGVTYEGKFGGTSATFTLLPLQQQTLMMIRQSGGEGAPDQATLDAVISTFKFGVPAPAEDERK
jgi:hypothetical protein